MTPRSYVPKGDGDNRPLDLMGERRSPPADTSTSDPKAQLHRKGEQQETLLSCRAHPLTENRNGVFVDVELIDGDGYAAR